MNLLKSLSLNKCFAHLAVLALVPITSVNAAEWSDSIESPPGFSEFAPPSSMSAEKSYKNDYEDKREWRSGSTFNTNNKARYVTRSEERNPWKPHRSSRYKKSFTSQRPWGKVPERKPSNANNMRFHDQRFKRWSHQADSGYHNNFLQADPFGGHSRSSLPFMTNYGFPGGLYNSHLITPPLYSGGGLYPVGYGGYPGGLYPYGVLPRRSWAW